MKSIRQVTGFHTCKQNRSENSAAACLPEVLLSHIIHSLISHPGNFRLFEGIPNRRKLKRNLWIGCEGRWISCWAVISKYQRDFSPDPKPVLPWPLPLPRPTVFNQSVMKWNALKNNWTLSWTMLSPPLALPWLLPLELRPTACMQWIFACLLLLGVLLVPLVAASGLMPSSTKPM